MQICYVDKSKLQMDIVLFDIESNERELSDHNSKFYLKCVNRNDIFETSPLLINNQRCCVL